MKARELRRVLERKPLSYTLSRAKAGSHAILKSDNYPQLVFAFHDNQTIPPGLVKKILVRDVGLSEEEALALL
jgi:predicted RNA binding protein YcfA (HicA-like mRNA interferase family)